MTQKKWVITVFCFLLTTLMVTGVLAIAAEVGTKDDPLVTVSYITSELMPSLNKRIDEALTQKTQEYTTQLTEKYQELLTSLNGAGLGGGAGDDAFINAVAEAVISKQNAGAASSGVSEAMKKVTVAGGKTVTLGLGSEVLLRLGDASCVATGTPGLIDLTSGEDLTNGKALQKNHLYICTVEGRGMKASGEITVFIRGGYSIK